MRDARGLATGTRTGRLRIVERLLLSWFAGRPVVVDELQADDLRQFITDQLDALGTTSNAITGTPAGWTRSCRRCRSPGRIWRW